MTPAERLREAAVEAIKASPRNWDGVKDGFYKAVKLDAELLWELFAEHRVLTAQKYLTIVSEEVRSGIRMATADADYQRGPTRPTPVPESPEIKAARRESLHRAMSAVGNVARLSLLDTFKINGAAIGDLTVGEAKRWAVKQGRDVRFVEMLTQNLPANAVIRKFRSGDDARQSYEAARSGEPEQGREEEEEAAA